MLTQLKHIHREIQMDKRLLKNLMFSEEANTLIRKRILAKEQRLLAEAVRICDVIDGIEDSLIRQIFTLRYIGGYHWTQIAMRIGGGNTPDGVRMLHNRYLKKLQNQGVDDMKQKRSDCSEKYGTINGKKGAEDAEQGKAADGDKDAQRGKATEADCPRIGGISGHHMEMDRTTST